MGKTFLIREFFRSRASLFEITGRKGGSREEQLARFKQALEVHFHPDVSLSPLRSWREAFQSLTKALEDRPKEKWVVFLDELPWLATPKSGLMEELDVCWNTRW